MLLNQNITWIFVDKKKKMPKDYLIVEQIFFDNSWLT